jgi:3-oxoacyl-[acyl-carrier-protein] synthase-1
MLEAVARTRERVGARRVALIIGTSTSGMLQAEWAYQQRLPDGRLPPQFDYQGSLNAHSVARFVAAATGLEGPAYVISTACSSSSKVFAAAARLMGAGIVDAALVGGVDTLCLTTLHGFGSLELLATGPCRPFSLDRDGISLGEGAGYALLEPVETGRGVQRRVRRGARAGDACATLLGWGESSDAHHLSTPHPDGLGAELAMRAALQGAGVPPAAIDYINLHGTGTRTNDAAEGRAVARVFGAVPSSSTKGWFGHLLGAAGIAEAAVCLLALEHGLMPGTLNTAVVDPDCPNRLLLDNVERSCNRVLSNSFGFGGSNCSLLFGAAR